MVWYRVRKEQFNALHQFYETNKRFPTNPLTFKFATSDDEDHVLLNNTQAKIFAAAYYQLMPTTEIDLKTYHSKQLSFVSSDNLSERSDLFAGLFAALGATIALLSPILGLMPEVSRYFLMSCATFNSFSGFFWTMSSHQTPFEYFKKNNVDPRYFITQKQNTQLRWIDRGNGAAGLIFTLGATLELLGLITSAGVFTSLATAAAPCLLACSAALWVGAAGAKTLQNPNKANLLATVAAVFNASAITLALLSLPTPIAPFILAGLALASGACWVYSAYKTRQNSCKQHAQILQELAQVLEKCEKKPSTAPSCPNSHLSQKTGPAKPIMAKPRLTSSIIPFFRPSHPTYGQNTREHTERLPLTNPSPTAQNASPRLAKISLAHEIRSFRNLATTVMENENKGLPLATGQDDWMDSNLDYQCSHGEQSSRNSFKY